MYAIKDLFEILVIVSANVIDPVILDYKNCKCKKSLVDKLVEECTENIEETRVVEINLTECKLNPCTVYVVLFSIIFTINTGSVS